MADRKKLLAVKRQHPDIDIRLLFQADNKLNPRSKVRYTEWAKKNGFPAAVGAVPQAWIREARRACQSET